MFIAKVAEMLVSKMGKRHGKMIWKWFWDVQHKWLIAVRNSRITYYCNIQQVDRAQTEYSLIFLPPFCRLFASLLDLIISFSLKNKHELTHLQDMITRNNAQIRLKEHKNKWITHIEIVKIPNMELDSKKRFTVVI